MSALLCTSEMDQDLHCVQYNEFSCLVFKLIEIHLCYVLFTLNFFCFDFQSDNTAYREKKKKNQE